MERIRAAKWKKEESAGAQPTQPKGIFRDGQPSLNPALYMAVREHSTLTCALAKAIFYMDREYFVLFVRVVFNFMMLY